MMDPNQAKAPLLNNNNSNAQAGRKLGYQEESLAISVNNSEETSLTATKSTKAEISCLGFMVGLLLNILLFPLLLVSFFTVQPQEEVLVLLFGVLFTTYKTPGIKWFPMVGRELQRISTKAQTHAIHKTTVVDARGNPISIGAVITFKFVDTAKAAFDVQNPVTYVQSQGLAVLKRVASRYPYESVDGISLQSETAEIGREMVTLLQQKVAIAGAKVLSFELTDLQYAPEIAQGMLVRQQANALIEARKSIVDGAVLIVTHAVKQLTENGIVLSEREQGRLISNLLAVICGDSRVQPTFQITDVGKD